MSHTGWIRQPSMLGSIAPTTATASVGTDELLEKCRERAAATVRTAAFWGAVLLPLVHVSALYRGTASQQTGLFIGLLIVNVLCFVIGHEYSPQR